MDYKKINKIKVDGNGNINLQDVSGQNININYNDTAEIEKLINSANAKILEQLKQAYAAQQLHAQQLTNSISKELAQRRRKGKIQSAVIVVAVLLLVVVSAIAYLQHMQDFAFSVKLNNTQQEAVNKGVLKIELADQEITADINPQGEAFFKNLPAKYKNEEVQFSIVHPLYAIAHADSLYTLTPNANFQLIAQYKNVNRIWGMVKDEDNQPIGGVSLTVAEQETTSLPNGKFSIDIPSNKQQPEQRLTAHKAGYQLWDYTTTVDAQIEMKIILRK